MKAYTSIKQSKRLAEILPIESADMWYGNEDHYKITVGKWKDNEHDEDDVPCWSLAALINVLPTTIGNFFEKNALRLRMDKGVNDFNIWYENFDCGDVAEGLDVIENNPVDACVDMIEKLYEQELL